MRWSPRLPTDPSRWGAFPHTVLHFGSAPPLAVDLREPVSADVCARLRELFPGQTFGVITASNPMGDEVSPDENADRNAALRGDVGAMGARWIGVDACSPDRSHCEHSIAVALDEQPLVDLACQYEQLAIFWYDGEAFWIVPARSTLEALRLPA
jgi:hypothetical protein